MCEAAIESAQFHLDLSIPKAFTLGVIGGAAITLMTWMERGSKTEFGKIVAAISVAFLLAATPLNHVIIVSLEIFAALHSGASFGYADWARIAALATLANMVGGLLLVTVLRLIQVGGERITEEQERPSNASRNDEDRKRD